MTFRDLADRVLRLRLDADQTPDHADQVLLNLGALAARRYARFAHEKHPRFDPELVKVDPGRDDFGLEDVCWSVAWRTIIAVLSVLYRNELPPMPGAATLMQCNDGPGIKVRAYEFKPEHWRQRAEDYRAAMLLLSRMAGERADCSANPNDRSVPAGFVHSECFRSVNWHGQEFSFTSAQASVVQRLFKAWQAGTPNCADEYIYEGEGKLVDLFKTKKERHPAWGTLIVCGKSRGTRRLNISKTD